MAVVLPEGNENGKGRPLRKEILTYDDNTDDNENVYLLLVFFFFFF